MSVFLLQFKLAFKKFRKQLIEHFILPWQEKVCFLKIKKEITIAPEEISSTSARNSHPNHSLEQNFNGNQAYRSKKELWLWGIAAGVVISVTLFFLVFNYIYQDRFFQGVYIEGVAVGGLTKDEARQKLEPLTKLSSQQTQVAIGVRKTAKDSSEFVSLDSQPLNAFVLSADLEAVIDRAYQLGRRGGALARVVEILGLINHPKTVELDYPINNQLIEELVLELSKKVNQPGETPKVTLQESNNPYSILMQAGEDGYQIKTDESVKSISAQLHQLINIEKKQLPSELELQAVGEVIAHQLNEQQLEETEARVGKFVSKTAVFSPNVEEVDKESRVLFTSSTKKLDDTQLIELLDVSNKNGVNLDKIKELITSWASEIDQEPVDAIFDYNPQTMRAVSFSPHQPGLKIDQEELVDAIVVVISEIEQDQTDDLAENKQFFEKEMVVRHAEPKITLAQTNDLGINELIGFGESYYRGSIASRLHNVLVASSYLNTTIVKPGEEFSFNRVVGKVDGTTGYQKAYVIRSGSTLLEFGGGVCQVSTTMFRAMLDAGVNITKRLPHSYRVSYYELNNQPGFDATVYSGEVDLRFINDTPGHLLIIAEADSTQAYMTVKIYGTSDGRYSEISNYKQWGYTTPPPPQEIPDANLAPGEKKRVENAIPGLKTSFDWLVYDKNGEVLHQKIFYSNYQAWGIKYLVGI